MYNLDTQNKYIYTEQELIDFLNGEESCRELKGKNASSYPQAWHDSWAAGDNVDYPKWATEGVRKAISGFMDQILEIKEKGRNLERSRLSEILTEIEGAIASDLNADELCIDIIPDAEARRLDSFVYLIPDCANYYLTFLNFVADIDEAAQKLFRCEFCTKLALRTYLKRPKRFCSDRCRSHFHNRKKDPEKERIRMRMYRQKLKEETAALDRKLSKHK